MWYLILFRSIQTPHEMYQPPGGIAYVFKFEEENPLPAEFLDAVRAGPCSKRWGIFYAKDRAQDIWGYDR